MFNVVALLNIHLRSVFDLSVYSVYDAGLVRMNYYGLS